MALLQQIHSNICAAQSFYSGAQSIGPGSQGCIMCSLVGPEQCSNQSQAEREGLLQKGSVGQAPRRLQGYTYMRAGGWHQQRCQWGGGGRCMEQFCWCACGALVFGAQWSRSEQADSIFKHCCVLKDYDSAQDFMGNKWWNYPAQKFHILELERGSAVKSACYSSRRAEFGFQHPCQVTYNHL